MDDEDSLADLTIGDSEGETPGFRLFLFLRTLLSLVKFMLDAVAVLTMTLHLNAVVGMRRIDQDGEGL